MKATEMMEQSHLEQILEWNRTPILQINESVHSLIAKQFRDRRKHTAIEAWDGSLSYAELDLHSSVLAAHLCQLGVTRGTIVPICFPKSRWVLVAMLAVMTAGGGYVLLDESQPSKRMEYVYREVNASVIIASEKLAARAQTFAEQVLMITEQSLGALAPVDDWTPPSVSPDDVLYIIFTSGSTGAPKGVMMEHGAFSSAIAAFSGRLGINQDSRVLQFSSYTWDTCMEEMLFTLVAGGCLCIPSNEDRMSNLAGAVVALRANFMDLAATVSRSIDPISVPDLKTLVLGGEALKRSDVERWAHRVKLINAYGVTECGGTVTTRSIDSSTSEASNIGVAAGCITWIVDQDDHEVLLPPGEVGELIVEGPIVSRGYLNRTDLTTLVFIDAPAWRQYFPLSPLTRPVYRTGDLCCYASDGSLRYHGRKDSQVKIGGQRVELGEVEHHVKPYFPLARQVKIIFVSPSSDGASVLIALIEEPHGDSALAHEESPLLRPTEAFRNLVNVALTALREKIPAYMIPNAMLPLREIPKLESGKADLQTLTVAVRSLTADQLLEYSSASASTSMKRMPETPPQQRLQHLWSEVLGLPLSQIGLEDDFFGLGGRSLDAMQLVSKARRDGLAGLTVTKIFQSPSLAQLATAMSAADEAAETTSQATTSSQDFSLQISGLQSSALSGIDAGNVAHVFPATDFQCIWLTPSLKNYDFWRISFAVNVQQLQRALQTVVDRHSILRTIFVSQADGIRQVVLRRLTLPFTHHDCDSHDLSPAEQEAYCASLCQKDSEEQLHPGSAYLKATLISFSTDEHTLILRTSHAQWDKEALAQLFGDLVDAYNDALAPLLGPTVDFPLYMQYRLAQNTSHSLAFWREYLYDAPGLTVLPILAETEAQTSKLDRTLVGLMRSVPHPSPINGITVATLVKAAWAVVLARLTQTRDLVFGHTVHGRSGSGSGNKIDFDNILGCCLNTIPIRVSISSTTTTARDLLHHVQQQYVKTLAHDLVEPSAIFQTSTTTFSKHTKEGEDEDGQIPDFGSVVTHDHADVLPVAALTGCGGKASTTSLQPFYPLMTPEARKRMRWPPQIVSSTDGTDLNVGVMAFSDVLSQARAEWLLQKLVEAVDCLASHHHSADDSSSSSGGASVVSFTDKATGEKLGILDLSPYDMD